MLKSPRLTRTAVIAATVISLGATPAVAREADAPLPARQTVTTAVPHGRQWTQPRTDAIGVRPVSQPVAAAPAPAVPLDRATPASSGPDWLLIAIGSSAVPPCCCPSRSSRPAGCAPTRSAPDRSDAAMLVFVLIGVGTAVAVLGAGYAVARRATRRIAPREIDVRVR